MKLPLDSFGQVSRLLEGEQLTIFINLEARPRRCIILLVFILLLLVLILLLMIMKMLRRFHILVHLGVFIEFVMFFMKV